MPLSLSVLSAPALFALASLSPSSFMTHEDLNQPIVIPPQPKQVEAIEPGVYTGAQTQDVALFSHPANWNAKNPTYLMRPDMSSQPRQVKFFLLPCANADGEDLYLMQEQTGHGATRNTFITMQGNTGFTSYALFKADDDANANATGIENITMSNRVTSAAFVVGACTFIMGNYLLAPGQPWQQKVIYSTATP